MLCDKSVGRCLIELPLAPQRTDVLIGGLRRRLGLRQPKDVIWAQTTERVRRFRARETSPDRE